MPPSFYASATAPEKQGHERAPSGSSVEHPGYAPRSSEEYPHAVSRDGADGGGYSGAGRSLTPPLAGEQSGLVGSAAPMGVVEREPTVPDVGYAVGGYAEEGNAGGYGRGYGVGYGGGNEDGYGRGDEGGYARGYR